MKLHLEGKQALITGGSMGIGLASARLLAEEGAKAILVDRDPATLADAATQITNETRQEVQAVALDIAVSDAPRQLVARFPDVDLLVNNAGAIPGGPLDQVSAEA